jgi:hypothetical protein
MIAVMTPSRACVACVCVCVCLCVCVCVLVCLCVCVCVCVCVCMFQVYHVLAQQVRRLSRDTSLHQKHDACPSTSLVSMCQVARTVCVPGRLLPMEAQFAPRHPLARCAQAVGARPRSARDAGRCAVDQPLAWMVPRSGVCILGLLAHESACWWRAQRLVLRAAPLGLPTRHRGRSSVLHVA